MPLPEALAAARHALLVGPAGLSGEGAPLVSEAVRNARFIFIGEDHITREIPLFTKALCDMARPQGLSALALEVGPRALEQVTPVLAGPDRERRMARFNAEYPAALAFLSTADDNEMAAHCMKDGAPGFRLIGADQEFLGAAGLLLDRILATRLSPAARTAVRKLRVIERERAAAARKSGNPQELFLPTVTDAELAEAEAGLATGGTPAARALLGDLKLSRDIYRQTRNESNLMRARLLKRNLHRYLPRSGKIIGKFGDWHVYKGYNPLGNRDLGNYVAEIADEEGTPSLHILVLGAKGTHGLFAGYGRPTKPTPFVLSEDRDYRWFKLATDIQLPGGWTLFDLRRLRHARVTGIDADWRRVIDGFDLMIVIPEISSSTDIS